MMEVFLSMASGSRLVRVAHALAAAHSALVPRVCASANPNFLGPL